VLWISNRLSDSASQEEILYAFKTSVELMKKDPASNTKIAGELNLPPEGILFLSDIIDELDAAKKAGMKTCLLVRGGEKISTDHAQAHTFDRILPASFS